MARLQPRLLPGGDILYGTWPDTDGRLMWYRWLEDEFRWVSDRGTVVGTASFANWTWFMLRVTGPKIEINGQPFVADWGPWMFDLPAGQYQLRVSTCYLGEFGPAHISVFVYPRQQTTVYYRPPAAVFMAGAIGFTPQPTRGIRVMFAVGALIGFVPTVILMATLR